MWIWRTKASWSFYLGAGLFLTAGLFFPQHSVHSSDRASGAQEKKDLVEYMKALNGEGWQMTAPAAFPQ